MPRLKPVPRGPNEPPDYLVALTSRELGLLKSIPRRIRDALLDPTRAGRIAGRLFPKTHDDPEEEALHRELIGRSLLDERLEALTRFEAILTRIRPKGTAIIIRLQGPDIDLWLHVINDLRLLLGTELDIRDNEWSERAPRKEEDVPSYLTLLALTAFQGEFLDGLGW